MKRALLFAIAAAVFAATFVAGVAADGDHTHSAAAAVFAVLVMFAYRWVRRNFMG